LSNIETRIKSLQRAMRVKRVDAFLVLNIKNIRYLTGFTGSSAFAFITRDRSFFSPISDIRSRPKTRLDIPNGGLKKGREYFLSKT
jgi:Xaa-Pro aminopeptidase